MRYLVFAAVLGCVMHVALAESPQRYMGVVRRMPGGRPVAGVRVSACIDLASSPTFPLLRRVNEFARTRTAKDGTFTFTLSAPRGRLWFMAWGWPKITQVSPSSSMVDGGGRVLRQPSPYRLNVIEVPRTFQSRVEPW
jgi:hypothetical protein